MPSSQAKIRQIDQSTFPPSSQSSVVEGEVTTTVRVVRLLITGLVLAAVVAGIVRGLTTPDSGGGAVVSGLFLTQVALAAVLILLGGFVEGLGFGLSLGTNWPYTSNIWVLLIQGDPEAAHRIVATLVGLIGLVLVTLAPTSATINGLILIVLTAALGMGTLHVLSGRLPSLVHGVHGLLAYGVFVSYLMTIYQPGVNFWSYLSDTPTLCVVLFAVLLGGMTTGHRGFGEPIGAFSWPQRAAGGDDYPPVCRLDGGRGPGEHNAGLPGGVLFGRRPGSRGFLTLSRGESQAEDPRRSRCSPPVRGTRHNRGHRGRIASIATSSF